jgi:hypothetical protein
MPQDVASRRLAGRSRKPSDDKLHARASMRTRIMLIPSALLGLGVPLRELNDREQQIIRLLGDSKSLTEIPGA